MSSRRIAQPLVGVVVLSAVLAGPVAAARPAPAPAPPHAPPPERAMTAEEAAASAAKIAAAEAYLAAEARSSAGLQTLACVVPNSMTVGDLRSTDLGAVVPQAGCTTPWATLSVEARDQTKAHYCGPAVGQVIANYAWAVQAGKNKWTQAQIAGWMKTDIKGFTNAPELRDGLNKATAGSPRRPANFAYVMTDLIDTDRDGQLGDQLHGYVRANVSGSKMPLALAVKPHDRNSKYRLASWPKPVNSVGHWIAAYGWFANWENSDKPMIAYTDSSRDEGGSTGKFWDPTRHLAAMIREHTGRFVW